VAPSARRRRPRSARGLGRSSPVPCAAATVRRRPRAPRPPERRVPPSRAMRPRRGRTRERRGGVRAGGLRSATRWGSDEIAGDRGTTIAHRERCRTCCRCDARGTLRVACAGALSLRAPWPVERRRLDIPGRDARLDLPLQAISSMAPAVPSRVWPVLVAFALGALVTLAAFGATRLAGHPPPKAAADPPPQVVREYVIVQPPAPTENFTRSDGVSVSVPPLPPPAIPEVAARRPALPAPAAPAPPEPAQSQPPPGPPSPAALAASAAAPIASLPSAPPRPPVSVTPPPPPPVPCGSTTCTGGDVCCSPACGICAHRGEPCVQRLCGFASYPTSVQCGANTCNVGEVCCNLSCGICAPPGVACSQAECDNGPTFPFSQACGMSTCNVGAVCCDARCGLCAPLADCARLHC
jgi:hypothetical protein